MLVLSRQRDESIFIGDNIKITVVDIRGDKVRLGFKAPPDISIHRQEVFDAIARQSGDLLPKKKKDNGGMLVLSRQRDEAIMIRTDIKITVIDIRGDKVRLGVEAPTEVPVHRQEVYEAIQREHQRGKPTLCEG